LNLSRRQLSQLIGLLILALLAVIFLVRTAFPGPTPPGPTPSPVPTVGPGTPSSTPLTRPTVSLATSVPPVASATPAPPSPTPRPGKIYLPWASNGGPGNLVVPAVPTAVATLVPSTPTVPTTPLPPTETPLPTPTRGPIRLTKLGLGVYASGGAMLPVIQDARPSVILLMDPTVDFAQEVRREFPKAFIMGRIYAASQPLDNPAQRGKAFADQVAATAVPLKGVVDAWMSYNEVATSDPATLIALNTFETAFANQLQNTYGIAAVAGNDGPRSVPADLYPKYYASAIQTSKYFGVHLYPDPDIKSFQDPNAADQVFYYRKIHAALVAAGIQSGPFIFTEVGLYNGWRGVVSDTQMGNDFTWLAGQMNADPYVLGMTVYGLFVGDKWSNFNIAGSAIPDIMGNYNTAQ
jgi:hypothetical protein